MASVIAKTAQIPRRLGYFITTTGDLSNNTYDVTVGVNEWTAAKRTGVAAITTGTVLQDMGEIAKVNGQIYRKVRVAAQYPSGVSVTGAVTTFWIVVPGGEYPVQGVDGTGTIVLPASVARLG